MARSHYSTSWPSSEPVFKKDTAATKVRRTVTVLSALSATHTDRQASRAIATLRSTLDLERLPFLALSTVREAVRTTNACVNRELAAERQRVERRARRERVRIRQEAARNQRAEEEDARQMQSWADRLEKVVANPWRERRDGKAVRYWPGGGDGRRGSMDSIRSWESRSLRTPIPRIPLSPTAPRIPPPLTPPSTPPTPGTPASPKTPRTPGRRGAV